MIWALFATIAMLGTAGMPLLHQHFKPDSLSMLFWMRVSAFSFLLIPVALLGFPTNPLFYIGISTVAVLAAISDVFYFNAVKKHGAGVVSRLLPASTIVTFFLWLAFDPALISQYMAAPIHTLMMLALICLGTWCASRLHHDSVSRAAIRDVWPVLVCAVIIPIISKIILGYADKAVAPLGYAMFQSLCLTFGYLIYQIKMRHAPLHIFFSRHAAATGALISTAWMVSVVGKNYALQLVDNPAYVSMILFTAPFFIALYERAIGKPDDSDKMAGFGLILSAAAIVLLQFK